MALKAYIDDSMEADRVLVFAGYIAPDEKWLSLSEEWTAGLRHARWKSVHMKEIANSPSSMHTAGFFYRMIEEHVEALVAVAIEIESLQRVVEELELPQKLTNPYAFIYRAILDLTAQYQKEIGLSEPIDFTFDKHGQADQVKNGFAFLKQHGAPDLVAMLGAEPRFEDDEECVPIQAADMLAWHVRKHWLKYRSIVGEPLQMSWKHKKAIRGFRANLDYKDLRQMMESMLDDLARLLNPVSLEVTFIGLDGKRF